MDFVELFKIVAVTVLLHSDGSGCIFENILLCEQSSIELMCPNQTIITEVNISTPTSTVTDNVCTSTFNTGLTSHNETALHQCIGYRSCTILGKDIDFSQIPVQTWKLNIKNTCDNSWSSNNKEPHIICPDKLELVRCSVWFGTLNIVSAKIETERSECISSEDSLCCDVIENRTQKLCNGYQQCNNPETSDYDWNFCIRIPKYVYVSFSCIADDHVSKDDNPISDKEMVLAVGVPLAVIIIVSIGLVLLVKRLTAYRNRQLTVIYQNDGGQGNTCDTDNYTSLQQRRDISNYMELDNSTHNENSTNDHTYMDVL